MELAGAVAATAGKAPPTLRLGAARTIRVERTMVVTKADLKSKGLVLGECSIVSTGLS